MPPPVAANATAWAAQSLTGLSALTFNLDGSGLITAIANDTTVVDAYTVSGTAIAQVDVTGLNLATISSSTYSYSVWTAGLSLGYQGEKKYWLFIHFPFK